jgi:glycosyltransferase involved in cell wall biosynthesis
MRIDIVFPVLPPSLDGIGDHTAQMARILSASCQVRILTAQADAAPISGVEVVPAFGVDRPWQVQRIVDAVAAQPPDWLVVQFNQFSYGRWGLNPFLPIALRRIRREVPSVRIAWMAHEDFVPATSAKFSLMRLWQKPQFQALGSAADLVFFSIDPWVKAYGPWFPETPVHHNPIGSNMPYVPTDPAAIRAAHGIEDDVFVAGFFGTLRARQLGHIDAALHAMSDAAKEAGQASPALLYVGPDGPALQNALPAHNVVDAGRLPAEDVSRHLQAMDLQLTPFIDGVSTRRGSLMAGLQHGLPTLGTHGALTDAILADADGTALCLRPVEDADGFADAAVDLFLNETRRRRMGERGRQLYNEHFAFEVTVADMLRHMQTVDQTRRTAPAPRVAA